jgi:hypothetical protein
MNTDLPNFRRRRPSLLAWAGGTALLIAVAFAAMLWLAQRPLPEPVIPEPKPHPDAALVTVVGDSPATEQVLAKALSAYNGGHHLFLFFGENRLPPGRYQLRVFDPPWLGRVRAEQPGLEEAAAGDGQGAVVSRSEEPEGIRIHLAIMPSDGNSACGSPDLPKSWN